MAEHNSYGVQSFIISLQEKLLKEGLRMPGAMCGLWGI